MKKIFTGNKSNHWSVSVKRQCQEICSDDPLNQSVCGQPLFYERGTGAMLTTWCSLCRPVVRRQQRPDGGLHPGGLPSLQILAESVYRTRTS